MSRRALVTGGSGGIGSAICRRLAADGLELIVHANRGIDAARALAGEIEASGGKASTCCFDLGDSAATASGIEAILENGPVQVLINNAGVHDDAVLPGMSEAQWQRVIDINLNGFFRVTQPLLLPMIRTRWGRIVNVTSVAAVAGNQGQVNYSAAKGALHSATKSLSLEVASRGITVNAVAPGIIETPMSDAVFSAETIARLVPMKRGGKPEEVAALVAFLCSEQAAYISGQTISINGGMV